MSANAVKAYADRLDEQLDGQRQTIKYLMAENYRLQQRIDDLNDAVISGKAIIPDAQPHE
jgi:cell division protein FtsB